MSCFEGLSNLSYADPYLEVNKRNRYIHAYSFFVTVNDYG